MNIEIDNFKPFIFMLVIDIIWITFNRKRYRESIKKATGKDAKLSFFGVLLAYASLIFSFIYFSKKLNNNVDMVVLGLCLYAVWNTTNMAIFKDWNYMTALIDTIWGGILFGSTYYVSKTDFLNKVTDIGSNVISKSSNMVNNIMN
jgi:uncharacterized membrane protein